MIETSANFRPAMSALRDGLLAGLGVDEGQAVGGLGLDQAGQHAAVLEGEDRRAVALDDLARRLEDRLDQVLASVLAADVRQVGADLAPLARARGGSGCSRPPSRRRRRFGPWPRRPGSTGR